MNSRFPYHIFPLGDSALTLDFGNMIDTGINDYVLTLFDVFKNKALYGVLDIVPAYSSLSFHYNVAVLRKTIGGDLTAFEIISRQIEKTIAEAGPATSRRKRNISIPVCYSGEFAPDIEFISFEKNISVEKIIQLHTERIYTVYMIGFLPGFAYMGEVNEAIVVPRKSEPRASVPAGSVGIAGKQTGIYPLQSPGGWQLLGRTPVKIFDKQKRDPVLLQPGDQVQFYSISEDEFKNY